jgi:hypothetical protein
MPLRFACPQCSQKLSVSSRKAGTTAACPRCKREIRIPKAPAQSVVDTSPPEAGAGADRGAEATEATNAQDAAPGEEEQSSFPQFVVYDDELYYDTEEPVEDVDTNVDYARVAVPRYILYVQGALLGFIGLICFALGMLAGGSVFSRPEPAGPQPVKLEGTVSYARGSRVAADASAVVIALPQVQEQLDERIPIVGLRPDETPPEATARGLEIIRTLGGSYTRADDQGRFSLELPNRGKYFVLVLSAEGKSGAGQLPPTEDILRMGRYFENAADLLGRNQYQWTAENLRADRQINVVFE